LRREFIIIALSDSLFFLALPVKSVDDSQAVAELVEAT